MADSAAAVRDEPAKPVSVRKRTTKKPKREPGRWVREAKGILALALAGFGLVALGSFDPKLHRLDQSSPAGPVGAKRPAKSRKGPARAATRSTKRSRA